VKYLPECGLYVTILTRRGAEEWFRHAHNVPDGVGIGHTPYTILVQSRGMTSCRAFTSGRDFRAWLGESYRLRVTSRSSKPRGGVGRSWSVACGEIERVGA
jgi:hypothetical protein